MTLRARLVVGLAIIALVLIVPLVIARNAMIDLHDQVTELQEREVHTSISLGSLRDALADVRAREVELGVTKGDSTVHQELVATIRTARNWADSVTATFADSAVPRDIRQRLDSIVPVVQEEFTAYSAGRSDDGDSISRRFIGPMLDDAERSLKSIERQIRITTNSRVQATELRIADAQQASLGGLVVAIIIAAAISIWLMRSISKPVRELDRGMRAVAEGDLAHQLDLSPQRRDEFGRLAASFATMSQQLAELDKLKAEFVSVASHELKTPINVILGYLQLMQQGIYGPLSAKQTEILETIEAQGRTLARLAAQLLDVTRFEAGGGRIEPRPLQLAALFEDLERAFHVLAVQRGVEFRLTMGEGLPDEVQWDGDRINEVIGNLLANAFKFTPAGGTVELSATPSDDHVKIEVRDSGAGVPPEQLPHIFEKFYQADNQDAASAIGTGLGLAIAKEIVEAHRGEIRCDSVVGEGTTFTLLLPTEVRLRRHTGQHHAVELEAVS
jgi:signal transduction histidine kinase